MTLIYEYDYLDLTQTRWLVENEIEPLLVKSPLYRGTYPSGASFKFEMTSCGDYGWVSDKNGQRYQQTHPITGAKWQPIPPEIKRIMQTEGAKLYPSFEVQSVLINVYNDWNTYPLMSFHQDLTEENKEAPIVSLSFELGGEFYVAGLSHPGKDYAPTDSSVKKFLVKDGTLIILADEHRLAYHAFAALHPSTSKTLFTRRINLTARMVYLPSKKASDYKN
jgi:alkylated DNA repair protein (DNA oxidative demethylase)